MKKTYSSETEMLIQGIYISDKALQVEADKSCNDGKTLQDYMRRLSNMIAKHTHRHVLFILRPLKIMFHSWRVHKMLQDVHTNARALHCDNLDCIQSRLNSVHVHCFE